MKHQTDSFLITALDIGTSKVNALIAACTSDAVNIIALGRSPSYGLKKGIVTNIEATTQAIHQAINEAERMANTKVSRVYTGIAGSHIRSFNSYGTVAIENQEVSQQDMDRVMEGAQAVAIPKDQKFLHILPQEFIVDHQSGIREPIGMSGVRLEAKVHIVTGSVNATQNIIKCVQRCGLEVSDIVLEQLASSQAVLTEDEKELGVCLLDIGGGTTDIAVFTGSAIRHTAVIPIAGDHVTRDIAVLLHTATHSAESIKRQHACAMPDLAANEWIEIPSVSDKSTRDIAVKALAEVVHARYEELFNLVKLELQKSGYWNQLPVGFVLTGGGAHVKGVLELAAQIFDSPVRYGFPEYQGNMATTLHHGCHSTGVGLIYHGYQHTLNRVPINPLQSIYQRMRSWFQNNF
jgi:cell division protein FtsA